jgi:putative peptidoglycan lipid II flippase
LRSKRIFRSIFSVTGVLILAKIVGFVKQMITAGVFGASADTDLINLSQELIANIEYVLVHTVSTAFVVVYIKVNQQKKEEGDRLVSDTIKVASVGVLCLILLVELAAPFISKVIAPSYGADKSALLAGYIRIYAPVLLFFTITSILTGLLSAHERFVPGQLSGLILSVVTIVAVLLLNKTMGVDALVVGFLGYAVVNFLFIGIVSKQYWIAKGGYPFHNSEIKNLFLMMGPLFFGYAMIFVNQQIDKVIVSGMEAGTVTAMSYASVLSNLVCTLAGAACSVLFTHMAVKTSNGEHKEAADMALKSAIIIITVLLPVTLITVTRSNDIVSLAFGRGAFDSKAVSNAGRALMGYGFCFVPFTLKSLYSRFQYGRQDTKGPMINSSIGIVVNIVFSIILSRFIGVFGVTIASSFSELVAGVLNMRTAKKHSEYVQFRKLKSFIPAWILGTATCIAGVCLSGLIYRGSSHLMRFIMATILGMIGYGIGIAPWFIRYKSIFLGMLKRNN